MRARTAVLVLVLSSSLVLPVAANNQGLEWGVSAGSRADYTLIRGYNGTGPSTHMEEDFYITILILQDIEDDIQYLSFANGLLFFWMNGTEFGPDVYGMDVSSWILPVGNWSLITEISASDPVPVEYIDTPELWGYYMEVVGDSVGSLGSIDYSKSDGLLNHIYDEVTVGDIRVAYHEIIRRSTPLSPIFILQVGVIAGSFVIVLVLVGRELMARRRSG
ncbi:MAG: hypothetical protein ACW99U_11260 [Candidatus Thorarchaeota archaeon]|jgi:hypothetical protein